MLLFAISILCPIFLYPDVFSLKHQAQHGNAFYNVNQRMVPAEHPLWAHMFSSAIKPEIITGDTWDESKHQLEKMRTNQPENLTQSVAHSQATIQRPLSQRAVEILFLELCMTLKSH